jgi:hypothetical protein
MSVEPVASPRGGGASPKIHFMGIIFLSEKNEEMRTMRQSLFERYGGFAKISKSVMSFYDKLLSSPMLSPYFAKTDMKRLIDHQTKFVSSLMGGPASYTSEHLERVHAHLNITEEALRNRFPLCVKHSRTMKFWRKIFRPSVMQ